MIVGISGKIGSGKDLTGRIIQYLTSTYQDKYVFADWLDRVVNYGSNPHSEWKIKKFAYALKEVASTLTGIPIENFEKMDVKNSALGDEWGGMIVRDFLQKLGTEAIRNNVHTNAWVNALFSGYKKPAIIAIEKTGGYTNSEHPMDFPNWVITDMRFPNELDAVRVYGITIRLRRNSDQSSCHLSETALDDSVFDYIIDNNGTIDELLEKVRVILAKENLY
jgi:hypothetical protein